MRVVSQIAAIEEIYIRGKIVNYARKNAENEDDIKIFLGEIGFKGIGDIVADILYKMWKTQKEYRDNEEAFNEVIEAVVVCTLKIVNVENRLRRCNDEYDACT